MKIRTIISFTIWLLVSIPLICSWNSPLQYVHYAVKILSIFIFVIGLPVTLLLNTGDHARKRKLFYWTVGLIVLTTLVIKVKEFLTFGDGYVTQEIIYVHKEDSNRRIEFQMEDTGALGCNKRTVEVISFLKVFEWITPINEEEVNKKKWIYKGEYVNEFEMKGG